MPNFNLHYICHWQAFSLFYVCNIAKAFRYWHDFYNRNENRFYKDRHYLHQEFPELNPGDANTLSAKPNEPLFLLEVGCGVGNALYPLLEFNPNLHVIAVDFAASAVNLTKVNPLYNKYSIKEKRLEVYLCDITKDDVPMSMTKEGVDLVLCMYVLSAIPPKVLKAEKQMLFSKLKHNIGLIIITYI